MIADDHPIYRYGLAVLLRTQADFIVVGEADNGVEAMRLVRDLHPDVVLLNLSMARSPGIDILGGLRASDGVRTIVLTAAITHSQTVHILKFGVRGILLKDTPTLLLFKSVRVVFAGQLWLERKEMVSVIEALAARQTDNPASSLRLTRREQNVLELVATGRSNRDIARALMVSEDTIKHHLTNIFDKTGVSSRMELALYAIEHRLVSSTVTERAVLFKTQAKPRPPRLNPSAIV